MTRWTLALVPVVVAAAAARADAQSWRTVTMSRQVAGERALEVEVQYAAGHFRVRPSERGALFRMELRYDEESFEPVTDYRDGRLRISMEGAGRGLRLGRGDRAGEMDLALPRDVPSALDLRFGAVRADLDLGGLPLTRLRLATGASETRITVGEPNPELLELARFEVGAADFSARGLGNLNAERIEVEAGVGDVRLDFSGDWQRNADVRVNLGLGALELGFPRGLGVRLARSTFLTSLDAQGLERRGDDYFSPDWDRAERRVTVDVSAAFGSIRVAWIR